MATNDTDEVFQLQNAVEEKGRFINSFNRNFKLPDFSSIFRFIFVTTNNTGLPAGPNEIDEKLPIVRHNQSDILKPKGLRFIWIGHASCFVQMNGFNFLTDPVFSERCGITRNIGPKRYRPPALNVQDLPNDLHAVIISHNHYDHLDLSTVTSLNARYGEKLTWFCGLNLKQWFIDTGCTNVVELDWTGEYDYKKTDGKSVKIIYCPAQHWSKRTPFDTNKSLWGSYVVQDDKYKFYFAGDTGYFSPLFKEIGKKYGPFDLAAIPIGAYEPRWMMAAQHVEPSESVQMHVDLNAKKSIGIHWGTFALAYEPYLEPPLKLMEEVKKLNLDPNSFTVLQHGEILDIE
ncbi:unnamed protein product [Didymodactylos carnosus]|uniref:N-acetylphosphatidylethanolamine-hydrolyzing phospholipase D n=2 Tax=Didymodactylos carnosus TaxID=1234261 RepID=A0A814C8U9_9BILA|nr:unnamed protein product [Didymodactylos carnosus]CAF3713878.1 unnamed protein product [Didymodactylos carnosus]